MKFDEADNSSCDETQETLNGTHRCVCFHPLKYATNKDVAKEYVNDDIGVGNIASKSDESTGLLIVKVLTEKCTRHIFVIKSFFLFLLFFFIIEIC